MSGLLFNKVPEAYMSVEGGINTLYHRTKKSKNDFREKSKRRSVFLYKDDSGNYQIASSVFIKRDIRIINIGKYHVDFQIESLKTQEFGMLRSAKLKTDKRGKYFQWKNVKYFISKRHVVL